MTDIIDITDKLKKKEQKSKEEIKNLKLLSKKLNTMQRFLLLEPFDKMKLAQRVRIYLLNEMIKINRSCK